MIKRQLKMSYLVQAYLSESFWLLIIYRIPSATSRNKKKMRLLYCLLKIFTFSSPAVDKELIFSELLSQ